MGCVTQATKVNLVWGVFKYSQKFVETQGDWVDSYLNLTSGQGYN